MRWSITTPPGKSDSNAIGSKLAEIREKRITRFEPIIKPERGLTYTGFSDDDFARQLDILKSLEGLGVVREESFDYVRRCSYCDHHGLLMKVACAACGSTNTDQGKVIEHLPCANIDLESNFASEDGGGLKCRKCKKRLRAIGVDYVKPGPYCMCMSCNTLSPEGRIQFVCLNCGRSLTNDELKVQPLFAYAVEIAALSRVMDESGHEFGTSIVRELDKSGIRAVADVAILGSSQLQHSFDVILYEPGDLENPVLAVDIARSAGPVGSDAVLNFFARCTDAKIAKKILVGIPGITEEAKKMTDAFGITAFESDGSNAREISEKIAASMAGEVKRTSNDTHLQEMVQSVIGVVEENGGEDRSDTDRTSLEKMLRSIINAPEDKSTQDLS